MKSSGLRLNNAELCGGVLWLALSLFVTWQGGRLGLGEVSRPGLGFALFWIGLLMCGLSLAIVARAIFVEGLSVSSLWAGTRWSKTLIVIATLGVYGYAFSELGFIVSTIPMMLILLRSVDPVRWSLTIPLGLGTPLLLWWVLTRLLHIQLPAGVFEIG